MSKLKGPPPELRSTFEYVPPDILAPLGVRLVLYPSARPGWVHAAVELTYTHRDTTTGVVKRWGELVSTRGAEHALGAWFRATFQLAQWLEGKDHEEVVRLYLWNCHRQP